VNGRSPEEVDGGSGGGVDPAEGEVGGFQYLGARIVESTYGLRS